MYKSISLPLTPLTDRDLSPRLPTGGPRPLPPPPARRLQNQRFYLESALAILAHTMERHNVTKTNGNLYTATSSALGCLPALHSFPPGSLAPSGRRTNVTHVYVPTPKSKQFIFHPPALLPQQPRPGGRGRVPRVVASLLARAGCRSQPRNSAIENPNTLVLIVHMTSNTGSLAQIYVTRHGACPLPIQARRNEALGKNLGEKTRTTGTHPDYRNQIVCAFLEQPSQSEGNDT